jgi:hypothetical protein
MASIKAIIVENILQTAQRLKAVYIQQQPGDPVALLNDLDHEKISNIGLQSQSPPIDRPVDSSLKVHRPAEATKI